MSIAYIKTFQDLQQAFMEETKIGTAISNIDSFHLGKMKRLLNEAYSRIAFHKEWDWRLMTRALKTTPKSTTGTVSVVNGGREITFSAAVTVDDSMIGKLFRVNGDNEWYEIISTHDEANRKAMLNAPYAGTTNATASYTLFKYKYGLWPDCADVIKIIPMTGTLYNDYNEVKPVSPREFLDYVASSPFTEASRPWCYTIMGKEDYDGVPMGSEFIMGYDFMENDDFIRTNEALCLYPLITSSAVLQITYGRQVEPLIEDEDQPLIPREKRHVILYAALAEWFLTEVQNKGLADRFLQLYERHLADMTADFKQTEEKPQLIPVSRRGARRRLYSRTSCSCPSN